MFRNVLGKVFSMFGDGGTKPSQEEAESSTDPDTLLTESATEVTVSEDGRENFDQESEVEAKTEDCIDRTVSPSEVKCSESVGNAETLLTSEAKKEQLQDIKLTDDTQTEDTKTEDTKTEDTQTEDTNTEDTNTEDTQTEYTNTEDTNTEDTNTEDTNTKDTNTEDTNTEDTNTEDTNTEDTNTEDTNTEDTKTEDTKTEDTHTKDTHTEDTNTEDTNTEDTNTEDTETVTTTAYKSNKSDLQTEVRTEQVEVKPDTSVSTEAQEEESKTAQSIQETQPVPEPVNKPEVKVETTVSSENKPVDYLEHITEMSDAGKLIAGKDLMYKIGFLSNPDSQAVEEAVTKQYKLAVASKRPDWIKNARYYGGILFSEDWINENLPSLGQKGGRRTRNKNRQRKQKISKEETLAPGSMCQDVRLLENPNLEVHCENAVTLTLLDRETVTSDTPIENTSDNRSHPAAGDSQFTEKMNEFVTDYTTSVIQHAMKQAVQDGLSESLIMEVIEDVTTMTVVTPSKKKMAPVDLSRTPRERTDQLAIGFNYHADQLMKDSPRMEAIMKLTASTKKRRSRDQLAVGFNYHSDQIVKNSPCQKAVPDSIMLSRSERKEKNNNAVKLDMNQNDQCVSDTPTKGVSDTPTKGNRGFDHASVIAMGFSYNSNPALSQNSDLVNGHLETEEQSQGEDALIEEMTSMSLDGVENGDVENGAVSVTYLPAGSVW